MYKLLYGTYASEEEETATDIVVHRITLGECDISLQALTWIQKALPGTFPLHNSPKQDATAAVTMSLRTTRAEERG